MVVVVVMRMPVIVPVTHLVVPLRPAGRSRSGYAGQMLTTPAELDMNKWSREPVRSLYG